MIDFNSIAKFWFNNAFLANSFWAILILTNWKLYFLRFEKWKVLISIWKKFWREKAAIGWLAGLLYSCSPLFDVDQKCRLIVTYHFVPRVFHMIQKFECVPYKMHQRYIDFLWRKLSLLNNSLFLREVMGIRITEKNCFD